MINILQNTALIIELALLYLPLMLGAYLTFSLLQIPNLSIESAVLAGSIIGSLLGANSVTATVKLIIGLCSAASAGFLVGGATGLLHIYGKLSHLLSNIVIIGIVYGLSLLILGGSHLTLINNCNPLHLFNYVPQYPSLPMLLLISFSLSFMMYCFFKTQLGVSCAAYGNNSKFLNNHKIVSGYVICTGLGLANLLAGITGYLLAQNNGFVDTHMANGTALLCITALILGKVILNCVQPINFALPIVGTISYFVLQLILIKMGFDLRYFPLIQALTLIVIFIAQKSSRNLTLGV